ncbi:MAG TPA: helicase-related protein [Vicinamibacteria bacterium]
MTFRPGDRVRHRFNEDLGPGRVCAVEGRQLVVDFPATGARLRLAADTDALAALRLGPGSRARLLSGERVVVEKDAGEDGFRLADGRLVGAEALWPLDTGESPVDRLAEGRLDAPAALAARLDVMRLQARRRAHGLASFLGGRIRLFPHQLWVAEHATRRDPVRWLLADEVGLGKTVEAGLILNHLVRVRGVERVLVVAPATLTVQWLGELWRKYHQVFVLLDEERLRDVARDHGAAFNPFDAHRLSVMAMEDLVARPALTQQAVEAGIDLLVVDEAHHLRRPPGHPGNAAYRAVAPVCALGRHVLLLSATPLEDDTHGFFRLLQLLRPDELGEADFAPRLARGEPLPPCTSSTRRADIGGLPPRVDVPVETEAAGWSALLALERGLASAPARGPAQRREKARRLGAALESGAAALAALPPSDEEPRRLARAASASDPRVEWLAAAARDWKERGEKSLVFVHRRETLEMLRDSLSRRAQLATAAFHEDLSPADRDLQVARFRRAEGPSLLVATESGGEGRNFEFCRRLVLFDLPWNPATVEQRIGRLDRIGRQRPVEIVRFRPPAGLGRAVADLFADLGLFREPLGGVERELSGVEAVVAAAAADGRDALGAQAPALVEAARAALAREHAAAYAELHRDRYRPEHAPAVLAGVPADLEALTRRAVLGAAESLGLHVEPHRDGAWWSVELGAASRVDSLPGVAGDATFVGTFDRETAVADETLDFFASGHPLVEGLLAEVEDGPWGRAAVLSLHERAPAVLGLAAVYAVADGALVLAVDEEGRPRDDWAERVLAAPLVTRRADADAWTARPDWPARVRRLAERLDPARSPVAVAALLA